MQEMLKGPKLKEEMFVPATASEHVEMYLKAIWLARERGEHPARISTLSKALKVASPSVVQMLVKLEEHGYVTYLPRRGAKLTRKGAETGRQMVRNTRLVECLMGDRFGMEVDGRVACGIEHHMTGQFADALCSLMNHPKRCPHGNIIPKGRCCEGDSTCLFPQ